MRIVSSKRTLKTDWTFTFMHIKIHASNVPIVHMWAMCSTILNDIVSKVKSMLAQCSHVAIVNFKPIVIKHFVIIYVQYILAKISTTKHWRFILKNYFAILHHPKEVHKKKLKKIILIISIIFCIILNFCSSEIHFPSNKRPQYKHIKMFFIFKILNFKQQISNTRFFLVL